MLKERKRTKVSSVIKSKKDFANFMESKSDTIENWKCPFCNTKLAHMVVLSNEVGDIHVHAPFQDQVLINQFFNAIRREQEKNFNPKGA